MKHIFIKENNMMTVINEQRYEAGDMKQVKQRFSFSFSFSFSFFFFFFFFFVSLLGAMRLIISSEDDPGRDALTGRKNAVTHTMTIQVDIPQSWTLEPVFKLKNWFIMNWNSKFPDRPISGRHSLMLNSDGVTVNDADVVRDFFEEGEQCYIQRGSRLPLSPSKVVGAMAKASVVARRKRMDARAAEIEARYDAESEAVMDINAYRAFFPSVAALASTGETEALRIAVNEFGEDVNSMQRSTGRMPPISCAIIQGYAATAEFLMENGADINMTDADGWSPLVHAVRNGNEYLVKKLLDAGAVRASVVKDGIWRGENVIMHARVIEDMRLRNRIIEIVRTRGVPEDWIDVIEEHWKEVGGRAAPELFSDEKVEADLQRALEGAKRPPPTQLMPAPSTDYERRRDAAILDKLWTVVAQKDEKDKDPLMGKTWLLRSLATNPRVSSLLRRVPQLRVLLQPTLWRDAFIAMDTLNAGFCSKREWCAFARITVRHGAQRVVLRQVFDSIDVKREGVLEKRALLVELSNPSSLTTTLVSKVDRLSDLLHPKRWRRALLNMRTKEKDRITFSEFYNFCARKLRELTDLEVETDKDRMIREAREREEELSRRQNGAREMLRNSHVLRGLELFRTLSKSEEARVIQMMEIRYYEKDEEILRQGEAADELFVILLGSSRLQQKLTVTKTSPKGEIYEVEESVEIGIIKSLQYMGEQALLDDSATRGATAVAREQNTCAAVLHRDIFKQLIETSDYETTQKYLSAIASLRERSRRYQDRDAARRAAESEKAERARLGLDSSKGNTAARMKELKLEMNKLLQQNRTLETIDLFAGMRAEELKRVASRLKVRTHMPGDVVLMQQAPASEMLILLRGKIELFQFLDMANSEESIKTIATLEANPEKNSIHVLGAQCLVDNAARRGCSAKCVGSNDDNAMALLAILSRRSFQALMRTCETDEDKQHYERISTNIKLQQAEHRARDKARRLEVLRNSNVMDKVMLFSQLDHEEIERIIKLMDVKICSDGELVFRQGNPADKMMVILEGQLCLSQWVDQAQRELSEKVLCTLSTNATVGEVSLVNDESTRGASGRAVGSVWLATLDRKAFKKIVSTSSAVNRALYDSRISKLKAQAQELKMKDEQRRIAALNEYSKKSNMLKRLRQSDILRKLPLFEALSDNEVARVLGMMNIRFLKDGDIVFREKEPAKEFMIVFEGAVRLVQEISKDEVVEQEGSSQGNVIAGHKYRSIFDALPHQALGEASLTQEDATRGLTGIAIGTTTLAVLSHKSFSIMVKTSSFATRKHFRDVGLMIKAKSEEYKRKDQERKELLGRAKAKLSAYLRITAASGETQLLRSLRAIFEAIDSNSDGVLSKSEMLRAVTGNKDLAAMIEIFPPLHPLLDPQSHRDLYAKLSSFDDSTKGVTLEGMHAFVVGVNEQSAEEQMLEAEHRNTKTLLKTVFKAMDTDGNGSISRTELLRAVTSNDVVQEICRAQPRLLPLLRPHTYEKTFREMDVDGDNSVDIEELTTFVLKLHADEAKRIKLEQRQRRRLERKTEQQEKDRIADAMFQDTIGFAIGGSCTRIDALRQIALGRQRNMHSVLHRAWRNDDVLFPLLSPKTFDSAFRAIDRNSDGKFNLEDISKARVRLRREHRLQVRSHLGRQKKKTNDIHSQKPAKRKKRKKLKMKMKLKLLMMGGLGKKKKKQKQKQKKKTRILTSAGRLLGSSSLTTIMKGKPEETRLPKLSLAASLPSLSKAQRNDRDEDTALASSLPNFAAPRKLDSDEILQKDDEVDAALAKLPKVQNGDKERRGEDDDDDDDVDEDASEREGTIESLNHANAENVENQDTEMTIGDSDSQQTIDAEENFEENSFTENEDYSDSEGEKEGHSASEDFIDSAEEDVFSGSADEDFTDSEEGGGDVMDSAEEEFTDSAAEDFTDSAEEDFTDSAEEDYADSVEEDYTDSAEEESK